MRISGRRICIAGSACPNVAPGLLTYAHELVAGLAQTIMARGGLILCGVGKNPRLDSEPNQPSLIFDWTVLETALSELDQGRVTSDSPQGPLLSAVATSKTSGQIPGDKRPVWDRLLATSALSVQYIEPGWTSGAVRRQRQAGLSDILITISGGEGVEHLAQEFIAQGKPVIPLDLELGASIGDGTGGSAKLFAKMRNRPEEFVRAARPQVVGALMTRMETANGSALIANVVGAVLDLIAELIPPTAFYVRLLNPKIGEFAAVERYFRQVIDPVIVEFGYHPVEMGRADATSPWINVQIFESIHYSAATIVDLTGVRSNCCMELGYAFGRERRVMITALEGTPVPFDASPIEVRSWNDTMDDAKRIEEFRDYWRRNINREPLVQPRNAT